MFVDTSALFAVLDADDASHAGAARVWKTVLESDEEVVTTNYVLVETFALARSRLGMAALRVLADDVVPALRIHWIDGEEHAAAVDALLTAGRRRLSLVDCTSFATMRRLGIERAFAFDRDFADQGFDRVP